jgi:hypothetical protein
VAFVARCFVDDDIIHVENRVDPIADLDIIETELMLADLESLEKRSITLEKRDPRRRQGGRHAAPREARARPAQLRASPPAPRHRPGGREGLAHAPAPHLEAPRSTCATSTRASPTKGNALSAKVAERAAQRRQPRGGDLRPHRERDRPARAVDERKDFLDTLGLTEPGLNRSSARPTSCSGCARTSPSGPKEARAWTIKRGDTAPQAAGVIHTDFEKGFIRAETIAYEDFVRLKGEAGPRDAGRKMRLEGKEYVVQDGDVMHFRFQVFVLDQSLTNLEDLERTILQRGDPRVLGVLHDGQRSSPLPLSHAIREETLEAELAAAATRITAPPFVVIDDDARTITLHPLYEAHRTRIEAHARTVAGLPTVAAWITHHAAPAIGEAVSRADAAGYTIRHASVDRTLSQSSR